MKDLLKIVKNKRQKRPQKKEMKKEKKNTKKNNHVLILQLLQMLLNSLLKGVLLNLWMVPEAPIVKKGGKYIKYKTKFVECLFDLRLLPVKINLPMVSIQIQWMIYNYLKTEATPQMSDLVGGYYTTSNRASMFINRYRVLTSREYENFNIQFASKDTCEMLCGLVTVLQNVKFIIKSKHLRYVKENQDLLVQKGLLMHPFLTNVNPSNMYDILRKELQLPENKKAKFKYDTLVAILDKRIKRARYEQFLLELATVYEGFPLYFPAFLDFRGRIYRTGILHFHERDLARSLLLFCGDQDLDLDSTFTPEVKENMIRNLWWSGASHYKSFDRKQQFYDWFKHLSNPLDRFKECDGEAELIEFVANAKHPFQFLSRVVHMDTPVKDQLTQIPVSMDASSSAYQIMSSFLLD